VTFNLETLTLSAGSHPSPDAGACVMEAVSFVAGEPWSDHPVCASAVIGAFLRSWNDGLNNDDRNRLLKPLVPRLVGTAGTPEQEQTRAWMALDWLFRVHTSAWLRAAGLLDQAGRLEALPEFRVGMDVSSVRATLDAVRSDAAARHATYAARDAARDAAWDAARAAARHEAWAAAREAAWDAAWTATYAAWDAARAAPAAAAWDAARDAAWDVARHAAWTVAWDAAWTAARDEAWAPGAAAGTAARAALRPTIEQLQVSALELVDRMIAVTAEDGPS